MLTGGAFPWGVSPTKSTTMTVHFGYWSVIVLPCLQAFLSSPVLLNPFSESFSIVSGYDSQCDRQHHQCFKNLLQFLVIFFLAPSSAFCGLLLWHRSVWDCTLVIKDWICLRKWLILLYYLIL